MGPDGAERRRWWARPKRWLRSLVLALGAEPKSRGHHLWRDVMPAIAIAIACVAVFGLEDKVDQNAVDATTAKRVAEAQREGRRVAVSIMCGGLRGVEDAGRLTLTDRLPGTKRYRRPSTPQERRRRRVYANAYNRVISDRIADEAGTTGAEVIDGVVKRDGSIDCDALREASGTAPPP